LNLSTVAASPSLEVKVSISKITPQLLCKSQFWNLFLCLFHRKCRKFQRKIKCFRDWLRKNEWQRKRRWKLRKKLKKPILQQKMQLWIIKRLKKWNTINFMQHKENRILMQVPWLLIRLSWGCHNHRQSSQWIKQLFITHNSFRLKSLAQLMVEIFVPMIEPMIPFLYQRAWVPNFRIFRYKIHPLHLPIVSIIQLLSMMIVKLQEQVTTIFLGQQVSST